MRAEQLRKEEEQSKRAKEQAAPTSRPHPAGKTWVGCERCGPKPGAVGQHGRRDICSEEWLCQSAFRVVRAVGFEVPEGVADAFAAGRHRLECEPM